MKIGVKLFFDKAETLESKFADLHKHGFDNCQLDSWRPELWTDKNAATINELCQKYNITISAFWCGWPGPCIWNFVEGPLTIGLVPEETRAARAQTMCEGADFAKKLGVTDVVTHMGFIPEDPSDPRFVPFCDTVREIAAYMKKQGQYLLFETGQETPVTMLRCFETVGADNLGVNLDTANLILYGKANPVDSLDVFGKYVRNLHAKDGLYPTDGHSLGSEVRIGDGKVDFRGVIEGLHHLGYTGYITIEREIDGAKQLEDILHAREYLSAIISEICGG